MGSRTDDQLAAAYEQRTQDFRHHMICRLVENHHKEGWDDCTFEYLLRRLVEEVGELMEQCLEDGTREGVISEAADVANFAMMIADRAPTYAT